MVRNSKVQPMWENVELSLRSGSDIQVLRVKFKRFQGNYTNNVDSCSLYHYIFNGFNKCDALKVVCSQLIR